MKKLKLLLFTLLLAISSTVNAQVLGNDHESVKNECLSILEEFCKAYYEDYFSDRYYVKNSISISSLEERKTEDNVFVFSIKGTHSYRGSFIPFMGRKLHSDVEYKADIYLFENKLRIKFWKWYEADFASDGHWEGPCDKTFTIDEEE